MAVQRQLPCIITISTEEDRATVMEDLTKFAGDKTREVIEEFDALTARVLSEMEERNQKLRDDMELSARLIASQKAEIDALIGKKWEEKAYVTRVLSLVEQAICCHIFPDVFEGDSLAKVSDAINYLQLTNNWELLPEPIPVKDFEEGKSRWDCLCSKLEWPRDEVPSVIEDVSFMDSWKLVATLEPVKLSRALEKLEVFKDDITEHEYDCLKRFLKDIPVIMEKSGVSLPEDLVI